MFRSMVGRIFFFPSRTKKKDNIVGQGGGAERKLGRMSHRHAKSNRKTYLDGLFSVGFLNNADSGVGDQDQKDDNGLHKRRSRVVLFQNGEHKRDGGSNKKNDDELILELLENHLPEGRGIVLGEFC